MGVTENQAPAGCGTGDLPRQRRPPRRARSGLQVAVATAAGVVASVVAIWTAADEFAPLIGWDVAALVYLGWVWLTVRHADAERTAELAVAQDPPRLASDALLLAAAVASLATVAIVLTSATHDSGTGKAVHAGAAVISVVLSWVLVHVVHALTYARLYYTGDDGGIDFNSDEPPRYSDFAYLAFTIGMTFQVSDTELQTATMRAVALRQALLSYLFGAVIVATTINLIVGLGK